METNYNQEQITPGTHISYWLYDAPLLPPNPLKQDLETDTVIVGAGIAGLSVAYCLAEAGHRVVVIEDGNIGSGETSHSSAHLTSALDDRYYNLEKIFGEKQLKPIAASHIGAIDFIEKTIEKEGIECDFLRVNGYLFLHPSDNKKSLNRELDASVKAGLQVTMKSFIPGVNHEENHPCLEFANQAQFHPLKYIHGLSKAILKKGGQIYTLTHAKEIDEKGIKTDEGYTVKAGNIVVATNTPVNNKFTIHGKQFPYRTYIIGARIKKGLLPKALWWDTGDANVNASIPPYHYVRLQNLDDEYDLLICGGEDHPTGLAKEQDREEEGRYELLETWARKRFDIGHVIYRWSGQVMYPMDSLGYIGRNPMDSENIYIITGDSGNGLTHGTIAGLLITDLIEHKENPWEDLYSPTRAKWSAAGTFFKEFAGGFISYLKSKPENDTEQIYSLLKDEGIVLKWHDKKCGFYRGHDDTLHVIDASCTHLHCTVNWNNDEKSWDCPCHGSRFSIHGKVMNGPANEDLPYHTEKMEEVINELK